MPILLLRVCNIQNKAYLCIVFFIVLDLRLIKRLGFSGIPFFMPVCLVTLKHGFPHF